MIHRRKTTQDILQEELRRERAAVLRRAGEGVEASYRELQRLAGEIETGIAGWHPAASPAAKATTAEARRDPPAAAEINAKIGAFNAQRELVRTRLYEFIVTREALGLFHHQRLEEIYRLPPKRRLLPEP